MTETFTIGDLAREYGVTLRTLRFYEDKGLLHPKRQGLNRIYSRRDRARLHLALTGKRVGFSLVEIKQMLDLYDTKGGEEKQLRVALDKFSTQLDLLKLQKEETEKAIEELTELTKAVRKSLSERERQKKASAAA